MSLSESENRRSDNLELTKLVLVVIDVIKSQRRNNMTTRSKLWDLINENKQYIDQHPQMKDLIGDSWTMEEIIYYLRNEKDPRLLAKWCELYLKLDY